MTEERDPTVPKSRGKTRKRKSAKPTGTGVVSGLMTIQAVRALSGRIPRTRPARASAPEGPRIPGRLRGRFVVGPEFFEPMGDAEFREFFGE
jgi:hypothetical protein